MGVKGKADKSVDVSILMPVLNEEASLPYCIRNAKEALSNLEELGLSGEILVCDNNSTDGSAHIARELGARVETCAEKGYGRTIITGVRAAKGRMIVLGDADGSYDFTEAVPMIEKLENGYEVCLGNRFKGKIMPGAMPFLNRYIGNPFLTGFLNLLFRSGLGDAHCGLRAFTREAFDKMCLDSDGMEFASEMVVKASLMEIERTEEPVTLHMDRRGKPPHLKPFRDGLRHLGLLLLAGPCWLYLVPSIALLGLSIFSFVSLFYSIGSGKPVTTDSWTGNHWYILAGSFFILGIGGLILTLATQLLSEKHGFREQRQSLVCICSFFTVKRSVFFGILAFAAALALLVSTIMPSHTGSSLPEIIFAEVTLATMLIVLGFQIILTGLLISHMNKSMG